MNIFLDDVSVSIDEKILLNSVSLKIDATKLTLLLGPNGAGKSTLLKVCSGDLKTSIGTVRYNDTLLGAIDSKTLATTRAVMTQSYGIAFGFTVHEIVSMGCYVYEEQLNRQQQDTIVQEVMAFLQIEDLAGRNFMTLSGGEQQRVQLARVLAQLWYPEHSEETRYLFLDEPTSSLDIFHQYQVMGLAKQLKARNIGVLAVVHDLSLAAAFADHLVLLNHGRIAVEGSPEEVLQSEHLLAVYGVSGEHYLHSTNHQPAVLFTENRNDLA